MTYNFNLVNYVYRKLHWKLKKICINQITFYFAEEDPGRGSEDIKKECNVRCFDFFFFSLFLMDVMGGKIAINL